ncbi:amino acid adenylation domain-containing protein [Myxococcus stipitatus]|uniref:amino acid adenylation domain-containing protein n=1 Tax=Myxococcus stipitatus TaxID=83455 RepID=UPI001F29CB0E|nr:non-ribosomal peptide synthetase [Myxococcus stipitatus]MCE9667443.1 amino acid adenylation domain-containing protein [Myxococcus stipitatus]
MSDISKQLSKLSPKQRELFEALLRQRQKQQESAAPPTLRRRSGTGPSPVSFAQQRLWLLNQIEGAGSAYNISVAVRLDGALDKVALERGLRELVRRHEALRTRFGTSEDGLPLQLIQPEGEHPLPVVDLTGLPEAQREPEARRLATAEGQLPFDLETGPLFRATLLRLSAERHVLLMSMHHSISDGWSTAVLAQEMGVLYAAYASGQSPKLPPLAVQYSDYAVWQREWLQGTVLQGQLDYWRRQLTGVPALLELPTDRPRPVSQSFRGAAVRVEVGNKLSEAVVTLAQRHGATPFMLLLAAWQLLLSRYSGQPDIVVGSPIAGRTRPELESLIGFFVNTLVLRANVDPSLTFRELLAQVKATTLGAYEHQDVPFERLVEELRPDRSLSYSPLFQVMFVLQNTPGTEQKLPGLDVQVLRPEAKSTQFDLTLALAESPGGFSGILTFNTDLFDTSTAERMVGHYLTLLREVVRTPDTQVKALSLLTPSESVRVLEAGRGPTLAAPEDWRDCLHLRFAAQAALTPQATALVCGAHRLTYAQLEARANQLATWLRAQGVGPEVRVGVCAERSPELVVALLGILKAGGAYVPLDPSYPADRLAFMLEDAKLALVLTQRPLLGRLDLPAERVLCLDSDWSRVASLPSSAAPESGVRPEHLAYVIYTSGSTGRPKGVEVTHANLAHSTFARVAAYPERMERYLMLSSFAFDSSVAGIFWSLAQGGTLILPRDGAHQEARQVADLVAREKATHLLCSPGLYQLLLSEHAESRALASLKVAIVAGESCPRELVRQHHALLSATLYNEYGPTEASVWSTVHRCSADDDRPLVPIGRPIPNAMVYVLDASLQPVPMGVTGELYIGGAGVARGYLDRPELTAERFLSDPFSAVPQARMYRTGDLARFLSDGSLEFLGRVDHQVKVRGFRIELGEIEAVLRQQPGVDGAVVVARRYAPGDTRLVGYLTPVKGHTLELDSVRGHLRERLPDYMVPATFVVLESFPLSPNGKVDRKALPAPEEAREAHEYVAPGTPLEERLASLFAELLQVERVGRHDNFFSLGGHSLLATRLVSRMRKDLGIELPLRALFETPTVASLAARREAEHQPQQDAFPLTPVPRDEALPLSFAQQQLWLVEQLTPGGAAYNNPAALRIDGALDVRAMEQSLSLVLRRHEALRTTFHEHGEHALQHIHPPAPMELPLTDLSHLPEDSREATAKQLAMDEALHSFDLRRGPLLRARLLRMAPEHHILLVTTHHIVSDGWSIGVLVREVAEGYEAALRGQEPRLPPLPVQYADFAAWQRKKMEGQALRSRLDYWREQLAGAPAALDLPTDRPRPAVQTSRGAVIPIQLPTELARSISALAHQHGATPFMVLLATWQLLLSRYSGQPDICVGSPIAGRTRPELESLIGFFVNTLVLRANVDPSLTFRELLAQVKVTTLGAYEHQDVPFERLVEELRPDRSLSYSPLFQVMFVLQNTPPVRLELPGLTLRGQPTEVTTAKFDLSLELEQSTEGLGGGLTFNTDLFDASTAERMVGHYLTLLREVVRTPDTQVKALSLLTPSESVRVLEASRGPTLAAPEDWRDCLHLRFAAQAALTPQATALVCGAHRLTYAQLEARANQLATWLRAQGVGPEVRVGVCAERSPELVVALLGILKAGGAYVPLDPSYPADRLAFMLEDAKLALVITQHSLLGRLDLPAERVLCLDSDWSRVASLPSSAAPESGVRPEHLAYVIYTSGSTGRPKGVEVTHANLAHSTFARVAAYPERMERYLMLSSFAFDSSVAGIFWSLAQGGTLILPRDGAHHVADLVAREQVTHLLCSPGLYQRLLFEHADSKALASLKVAIVAGESCPRELVRQHHALLSATLYNEYGLNEAGMLSTVHRCSADDDRLLVPIGRPIPNATVYVLGASLQPVPMGVTGELYVGGAGVARGYLDRPELTAERFLSDPFSAVPQARMYRTGDLARFLSDGSLEFLGRVDHQVKVRGFRIELGEIEAVLRQQPGVDGAVVVARRYAPGDTRLVGYLTPVKGRALELDSVRGHLRERLPDYMVPVTFVVLESFPLSPNGKVDRKALPAPDEAREAHEYVAPSTPLEERLASLFAELLQVERVGRHDNFFSLGGHSLLATRLVSRMRKDLGIELPLRALFETPTVASLAARREAEQVRGPTQPVTPQRPSPRGRSVPQSFVQQRLWLAEQLTPGTATYNNPAAVAIDGVLDTRALELALRGVVQRHEALRTTFRNEGDLAIQVIQPQAAIELPLTDLSEFPETERDARMGRLAHEEAHLPFNLEQGPVFRARLLRLAPERHVLLVTMHHIVSDGWSISVLVREVAEGYVAASQGREADLPPLPMQYADYAVWQHEWMRGPVLESRLDYWREQLSGAPAALDLPTDRPRPAVQTFRGAMLPVNLPAKLASAVRTLARQHEATPFMVLLATWQLLLSRYSGQQDLCVGSPVAGRTRPELEGLIGFFVNTLVFRARMAPGLTFRELLAQVKTTALDVAEHQDVPFEKLLETLRPAKDPSRSPLFQVTFTFQNTPQTRLELPGLSLRVLETKLETVKFDMSLLLEESPAGITGALNYNTDLFDAATVQRMMEHYRTLLESIVANVDQRLDALPLLTPRERQQLLVEWNATAADFPRDTPLHALFSEQAARTPGAVALVLGEAHLTYAQLEQRSNQLAHHLRTYGVKPGTRVGLCLERSFDLLVGLLAILKAGGSYVPVDHHYPAERISLLLQEASVGLILTSEDLADSLPAVALFLCLDADADLIEALPSDAPPAAAVSGDDLAYVMFTSGSTGRPKGVCIPHHAVSRLVLSNPFIHFGPDEVFLQLAPVSFDASTLEIWGALLHGARLVLAPPHTPSLEELAALLTGTGVTTLWLTAALFEQVVIHQGEALARVRQVLAGGDVLPALRVQQHLQRIPPSSVLVNGYGPTENTTFSSTHALRSSDSVGASVPIGRPLGHSSAFVLDALMQPLPIGIPGELYVGGLGLAWGYLNRPDLTAEKFVPHPFSSTPGERLYRTGDRARWRADGTLEFLGRSDFQVKVRGFRIELGEIEAALLASPGIQEAVVLAREDAPGDKRLVAYLVGSEGPDSIDSRALREHLLRRLPEYMVPALFVPLASLPLSPNGKVDRKALPSPDLDASRPDASFEAPRDANEATLADVWAQVLGVQRVGIDDSFFELGGDSIRGIQVVARLRERGLELSIPQLLQHPTIRQLSAVVGSGDTKRVEAASALTAFSLISEADRQRLPADVEDAYPLAALQSGMLFESALDPSAGIYHDMFSFHLEVELDEHILLLAFSELLSRHPILRTSFHLDGFDEPLQLVHRHVSPPLGFFDLRDKSPAQQDAFLREWAEAERRLPFDWARAPLLRLAVHRRSDTTLQFTVLFHHAILDGWSVAAVFSELFGRYLSLLDDSAAPPPPPLSASYRHFVALEREAQSSPEHERYWLERMEGAELANARPPRAESHERVLHTETLSISKSLQEALQRTAHEAGVPLKSLLLAVHLRVRAFVEGSSSVVTGIVTHGRPEIADGERLVGLFLNSVPFPLSLRGGSWLDLIREVARHERELMPHRRYPMARLQQKLGGQPLFHTLFNFLHFHIMGGMTQQKGVRVVDEMMGAAWMELPLGVTFSQDPDSSALTLTLSSTGTRQEAEQARELGQYYLRALEAVASQPHSRYEQVCLLSGADRHQVLEAWNDSRRDLPWEGCWHERFEQRAALTPTATAVITDEQSLTYAELNRRANQVAWTLRARGLGPESRVALCLERSVDMLVAVLGVLKSGAAYVPMDAAYPPERLAFMLEDSRAQCLLTQHQLTGLFPDSGVDILRVNVPQLFHGRPDTNPPHVHHPHHLAYVIYTSGSTGKPKGVMVQHASVMNLHAALAATAYSGVDKPLRVSVNAPLAFDASVQQLIQLIDGHTLCLVPQAAREDARAMVAWLEKHQVEVLDCAPSHLRLLLEEGLGEHRPLRLLVGGEAVDASLWTRLSTHPRLTAFNVYGPTECTVDSTIRAIRGASTAPTLGGPLANLRTYVLDAHQQPTPLGVPGELYISGAGLARGYLDRPALTAERFLPDPFSPTPGARMYRTGDKARWLPEGELEYLGRIDHQVKLRGFRIELGEIEATLQQHPTVEGAVVLVRQYGEGDQRLVAYVVPVSGASRPLDVTALRGFLKLRLPEYMVPAAFVVLDAFPLTTNGKVHRAALPAAEAAASRREYVAPRDTYELELARLFEELLGASPVSARSDFFELGGHSLLAVRLLSAVRARTGRRLPMSALFQAPTVEGLAALLRREPARWTPLVPIQRGGSRVPFFCVHPVGGTVFCYTELARRLGPEQPFYGLQAQGIDGTLPPHETLEAMAEHYVDALREVQPHGPYRLGGWSLGAAIAFEMARLLSQRGERVDVLALIEPSPATSARSAGAGDDTAAAVSFAMDLARTAGLEPSPPADVLPGDSKALLDHLFRVGREAGLFVPEAGPEQLEALLRVFTANHRALLRHAPGGFPGKATVLRGRDTTLEAGIPEDRGWSTHVATLEVREVPGDHYTLMRAPDVDALAQALKALLGLPPR